jgi:glycosyltransferase involved in cell wall biosynthesis
MPLVSVVVPVYNRSDVLAECINSVLAQTFQDFEIIIIDDGSTDNILSVIELYNDDRIKYVRQENSGGAAARNHGINLSKGDYIAFLDSDDCFLPNHLEIAVQKIDKPNMCYYSKVRVERGNGLSYQKPTKGPRAGVHFSEYLFCEGGFVPTITLVLPSALAKKTLYTTNLKYGQDKDFAIRLIHNQGFFFFNDIVTAVWNDLDSDLRVSSKIDPLNRLNWLNDNRDKLTDKAYYSDIGWSLAKAYSYQGFKLQALRCFIIAVSKRCFSFKTSLVVFLQIFLSAKSYRKLANVLAKLGLKP